MKRTRAGKFIMMGAFGIIAVLAFGWLVMTLWNAILPAVLGVKAISFLQALGILLLSKILFGGFGGRGFRGGPRGYAWRHQMKEKWNTMSEEEREKFKAEWKNRCGMRFGNRPQDATVAE